MFMLEVYFGLTHIFFIKVNKNPKNIDITFQLVKNCSTAVKKSERC